MQWRILRLPPHDHFLANKALVKEDIRDNSSIYPNKTAKFSTIYCGSHMFHIEWE